MNGETILVLEDNLVVMKGLAKQLHEAGYRVLGAGTTNEAISALRSCQPDLMILDLTLLAEDPFNGVSDGFAFKEWVQTLFPGIDLPVIVHTADDSPTLEWRAQAHGISRVVRKGAAPGELLEAVRQTLDEHKAKQG